MSTTATNLAIRPSPREIMELHRRCLADCQPFFNAMILEISMDTRGILIVKKDEAFERLHREESPTMKEMRRQIDVVCERYAALMRGEVADGQRSIAQIEKSGA